VGPKNRHIHIHRHKIIIVWYIIIMCTHNIRHQILYYTFSLPFSRLSPSHSRALSLPLSQCIHTHTHTSLPSLFRDENRTKRHIIFLYNNYFNAELRDCIVKYYYYYSPPRFCSYLSVFIILYIYMYILYKYTVNGIEGEEGYQIYIFIPTSDLFY